MMNRIAPLLFILILSSLFSDSFAQIYRGKRSNIVKIDLLGAMVFERYGMAFERVIDGNKSAQVGFQVRKDGYTVSPEFRFYILRSSAPEGLFVSPYGRILNSNIGGGLGFGFGGLVGYQSLFGARVSADVFIGPGFSYLAREYNWDLWAGIAIGLAF